MASLDLRGGPRQCARANSLKNGASGKRSSTPGSRGEPLRRVARPSRAHCRPSSARPPGPSHAEVDRGGDRHQGLVRADVRRGLLAADVLLAGLQRQDVADVAVDVERLADDPPGHPPDVLPCARRRSRRGTGRRSSGGCRAAAPRPPRCRRPARPAARAPRARADRRPGSARAPPPCAGREELGGGSRSPKTFGCWSTTAATSSPHRPACRPGRRRCGLGLVARSPRRTCASVSTYRGSTRSRPARARPRGPRAMFTASTSAVGAVVQRGVRDLEAGELADHRLVLEQGLEHALGELRLVRRVGGVELRAARPAPTRRRHVVVVRARRRRSTRGRRRTVARGELAEVRDELHLGDARRAGPSAPSSRTSSGIWSNRSSSDASAERRRASRGRRRRCGARTSRRQCTVRGRTRASRSARRVLQAVLRDQRQVVALVEDLAPDLGVPLAQPAHLPVLLVTSFWFSVVISM